VRAVTQEALDLRQDAYPSVWDTASGDSWLAGLRQAARRELITRLTLERVREGGLNGTPKEQMIPDFYWKVIESFAIGVAVALASAWLIHKTGIVKMGNKSGRTR